MSSSSKTQGGTNESNPLAPQLNTTNLELDFPTPGIGALDTPQIVNTKQPDSPESNIPHRGIEKDQNTDPDYSKILTYWMRVGIQLFTWLS